MTAAPDSSSPERRRSPRLALRIPLRVVGEGKDGQRVDEPAEAMIISANGALVKTGTELRRGSEVEVENPRNQQRARFRVIWTSEKPLDGVWEMGLELSAGPAPWGIAFPA